MDAATRICNRAIEYDAAKRRLWVFGQRCHHGATGAVLAAAAVGGLVTSRLRPVGMSAIAAMGGLLMVHDWKDRAHWFKRGPGARL